MDEKKRSFIVIGVIAGLLFLLVLAGVIQKENQANDNNNTNTSIEYEGNYSTDYEEAFSGEGKKVLFIGSSSCSICTEFTPYMKYLSEAYNFTYYYIDAATMDTEELTTLLEKLGENIDDFGTPYVAYLENGKKYGSIPGYMSESDLFNDLKENGIIASDAVYKSSTEASKEEEESGVTEDNSAYTSLSFIDYDQYEEVYNSNKKSIIVLGQTGCGNCVSFKPVINEIAKEKNIPIYYINMTDLTDKDQYSLMNSLTYFDDLESFGTPLTLIIENKKVVDSLEGYTEKEDTLKFFQKNGFGN